MLVIADEALRAPAGDCIRAALSAQDAWSAVPVIVLTRTMSRSSQRLLGDYETYGHVTLVERPVKMAAFIGTMKMALNERRHQQRIRGLLAEREQRLRERDEFLATLGHELRNPLAAIMTCAEGLDLAGQDAEQVQRCHQVVRSQAEQIRRLLDDLLDLSRMTRRKLQLQREAVVLQQVLQDAIDQVRSRIDEQDQALELEWPPTAVTLRADPMRLRQVFANILSNASRYSPAGGRIRLSAMCAEELAEVRIRNDGIGMAPETLDAVFAPFFQAQDRGRGSSRGLGVGLTLAKALVEMHAGTIRATSPGPGRGSEFTVILPVEPGMSESRGTPSPAVELADAPPQRILLIDDNQDFTDGLKRLLEERGHQVYLAHHGAHGIRAAQRHCPTVVLLDLGLPDLDGYEVAERLRRLPSLAGSRLIAVTGRGLAQDRRRSELAGIDAHLIKPVSLSDLEAAMTAA